MKCQTLNFQSVGLALVSQRSRKHQVYTVQSASGKTGVLTMAKTASDWRAARNQQAQLKRLAARLGA